MTRPVRHLVAARDAAEDVEQHGGDLLVGEDHLDGVTIASAFEPPPASRKFAGSPPACATTSSVDITRPGAVAEDADVAVELHVGEPALLRHLLLRVLGADVAERRRVRVAVERVAVDGELRVERDDLAALGDEQRVDLDEHRVLGDEGLVELREHRADRAG